MEAIFAVGAASVAVRVLAGRSALVSFAFIGTNFIPAKDVVRLCTVCPRVVLDSGAFSAWNKGTPIDLGAYVAHIEEHGARYAWIAALDAIGDAAASVANWREMRKRLSLELRAKVVPVYHEGEPLDVLDEYVSVGGLVGVGRTEGRRSEEKTLDFYDDVFNRHADHKFHAFGCGDPKTLTLYPFASFDCTTWERNATYAGKFRFPYTHCDKETRMRAYVEGFSALRYQPQARQLDLVDLMERAAAAPLELEGERTNGRD